MPKPQASPYLLSIPEKNTRLARRRHLADTRGGRMFSVEPMRRTLLETLAGQKPAATYTPYRHLAVRVALPHQEVDLRQALVARGLVAIGAAHKVDGGRTTRRYFPP